MKLKNKVTVIVPCYNVARYLADFLKLLSKQTLVDIEVIFVEDGSKDNTKQLLKKACEKDERFTLICNEKNCGAGYSRNLAVQNAHSDYIAFLDADDIIPEDYLELLYKEITKRKADLVVCDILVKYDKEFGYRPEEYNKIFPKSTVTKEKMLDNVLAASPTNKMFKKSLIASNKFAVGIINEDIPAVLGAIIDAKTIAYVPNTYYTYVQHEYSVQNSVLSQKKLDVFKAFDLLCERKKNNKILKKMMDALVFHQIILFFYFGICQDSSFRRRRKFMKYFYEHTVGKYNLRQNHHYWSFIDHSSKLVQIYYKSLLKLTCMKMFSLASLLVEMYQFYKKIRPYRRISIVKAKITDKDILKMANKNQRASNSYGTISVVVPNYNYAAYLYRRIYSILSQKIKINEIILLDDASTDNSVEIIEKLANLLNPIVTTKCMINTKNSGCVYKQWHKGFQNASSKYVWIAEADDYSDEKFLETVMKPFTEAEDVRLSYTDTSFMLVDGCPTLRSMNILIDLMKTGHWNKDYINDGINEIENYCFLNCTIANVSSVVFKNDNYEEEFKQSSEYKQVGDWLFYVNVMKKGKIAYTHKSLNYCCIHEGSATATTKKMVHYNEIKALHNMFLKNYNISPKKKKYIQKRYNQLRKEWHLQS